MTGQKNQSRYLAWWCYCCRETANSHLESHNPSHLPPPRRQHLDESDLSPVEKTVGSEATRHGINALEVNPRSEEAECRN